MSNPPVPSMAFAGEHEMHNHDTNAPTDDGRSIAHEITPYLGLRSRLSQIWINRWTVLLFLILIRLLFAVSGLFHNLSSAKSEALSACSGVESAGSALASMPHYLAAGVNRLAASGVEKAVHGLMTMLLLTVTGLEELLVFYVNMLTSTYACLITLAVRESLHTVLKTIEDVGDFLNKTLKAISDDMSVTVSGFQSDLNKFTSALDSIPKVLGSDSSIPQIDLTKQRNALLGLQLPSGLDQGLTTINNSIPTFDDVNNFTNSVLRLPFEQVKTLINGSSDFSFNSSVLPVPQKEQLSFCSDNNGIGDFFDHLVALVTNTRKVFIVILILLAIVVCIPMTIQEIRRWRLMKAQARVVRNQSLNPLDIVYLASRPLTAIAGLKVAQHVPHGRPQVLVRWVMAYATSPPALLVLALALTGLASCLCQFVLLKLVQKEVPALSQEVGAFADKVMASLDNASESWAHGTNGAISKVNQDINDDVFGWVNTTTHVVNETLNKFVDETTKVLNVSFGGTVLYEPMTEVFNCLVGLKILGIEKGLTWVSKHAHVEFPLLPADTFSLGAATSLGGHALPAGATTDKVSAAADRVVDHLAGNIRTEALISTCVLLVWVLLLLMAVGRACWLCLRRNRNTSSSPPAYETCEK